MQDSWEFAWWKKLLVLCKEAFPHIFLPPPSKEDCCALQACSSHARHQALAAQAGMCPGGHRGLLFPETPVLPPGAAIPPWHWRSKPWLFYNCKSNPSHPSHVLSTIIGTAFLGVSQSATCFKIKPVFKYFMGLGPEHSVSCRIKPCVFISIMLAQSFCQANFFSLTFVYFSGLSSVRGGG